MSYSNYNTDLKSKSTMKRTMNNFISSYVNEDTTAIVIDAKSLMSSKSLVNNGVSPENIVVINTDGDIIDEAHKNGHILSKKGISTHILPQLSGTYDIIYLDYCGTPEMHVDGFNPAFDLLWSADRIKENGIIVTTFSRRTKDAIEKANDMIPFTLTLAKEVNYCETVPMYSMILSKVNPRDVRNKFNRLKRSITPEPKEIKEPQYIIEKIVRKLKKGRGEFFEVKWVGYKKTTIEPRRNLIQDVPLLIQAFEQSS